jgi:hypothetical protein
MTPQQADAYAEKVLDAIDVAERPTLDSGSFYSRFTDDREHVHSALRALHRAEEGLREAGQHSSLCGVLHTSHARRYADARDDALDDLHRTGRLYGCPFPAPRGPSGGRTALSRYSATPDSAERRTGPETEKR